MILSCVVVDDEYLSIKVLEDYISRTENLKIMRSFKKPEEALYFLNSNPVDLLFLDIQMPLLDGFALLSKLNHPPMVIFTTARPDYAVKAYELKVLDYLLKPISIPRFQQAVEKAIEYAGYVNLADKQEFNKLNYLMINANFQIHKVKFKDIIYIEGLSEYVQIRCLSGIYYTTLLSLKSLDTQLDDLFFIRVHKSFIINKDHMQSFTHSEIMMINGKRIPIGRVYRKEAIAKLGK